MLQAVGWLVIALAAPSSSTLSRSPVPQAALLAVSGLFLASLSALPIGAVLSRYPRRRYRQAVIFQAALVLICIASFAGHPSVVAALLGVWPLTVIALLVSPGTREFVLEREARLTALQG